MIVINYSKIQMDIFYENKKYLDEINQAKATKTLTHKRETEKRSSYLGS